MSDQWFVIQNGKRVGPYASAQLKQLAAAGRLTPADMVWKEGMANPAPASRLSGLFSAPDAARPMTPPPIPVQSTERPAPPSPARTLTSSAFTKVKAAVTSFASTARTAAVLAARHVERTKLLKITLPLAYGRLGKAVFEAGKLRANFAEQHKQIDQLRKEQEALLQPKPQKVQEGIAAKAKAAALAAKDTAHAKAIQLRINSAMAALGENAYERCAKDGEYAALAEPITTTSSHLRTLEAEIAALSQPRRGHLLSPRRLLLATVCVVICSIALVGYRAVFSGNHAARQAIASNGRVVAPNETPEEVEEFEEPTASQQGSPFAAYYSNASLEPHQSWSLEKTVEFAQPYGAGKGSSLGHIFLLPNDTFAYCANDFHLRLCDVATNKELAVADSLSPPSYGVRYSDSVQSILWGGGLSPKDGATLLAWNCKDRKVQARLQVQPPTDQAPFTAEGVYSPDGKLIATAASENGSFGPSPVRVWDAASLQKLYETDGRRPIAFSPDGSLLAFGDAKEQGCILWDYRAGKKLATLKRPENDSKYGHVHLVSFVPNTPLLAVVSDYSEHLIELWNSRTLALDGLLESRVSGTRKEIAALAVAPDGTFLVTGSDDVRVWHLPSGRTAILNGAKDRISSVSISSDGNRIAVASDDKKVIFWNRRPDEKGEFAFGTSPQRYAGDPVLAKVRGPNGEKIMVGGDGPNTEWFFHYYLDKNGKKVMHGKSRVQLNGTGRQESNYDRGVLLSRSCYDSKRGLESSYKRLDDGNYQKDEYRTLSNGSTVQMRSVVTITKTDTGETIKEVKRRQIVADDAPLPSVAGRRLKVNVDTAGIDRMAWWVKKHNASLSAVECVATDDQLVITFDIDASEWQPVQQTFPILVRLFDRNGQYLKHFTTAEGFTVFIEAFDTFDPIYHRWMQVGQKNEAAKYKCVLLKPKGNRFVYGVNVRDLRDASIVEIGFTER